MIDFIIIIYFFANTIDLEEKKEIMNYINE
jgi:hypothetical protein